MLIVVSYDVSTTDAAGRRRLQKLAKRCKDWGVPVQKSLYECHINNGQFQQMRRELSSLIDPKRDSVRIYSLGNHYQTRVECIGLNHVHWDYETFVI